MAWNPGKTGASAVHSLGGSASDVSHGIQEGDLKKAAGGVANLYTGGAYNEATNAANAAGGSASNAWKTSVNDPLNKLGKKLEQGWQHAQDMFNDAYNGLQTPGGPQGGAGGSPMVVSAPGQGGGGVPGAVANPQITAGMNGDPNNVFRQGQMGLMQQLQAQAAGQGPSIAQNQLKMGQEQALAQSIALANSGRGGANPMMARQALQQNAQMSGQMANEAANLRLQEQQQAQSALGSLTGQGRQGDLGVTSLQQQGQVSSAQMAQAQNELASKYAQMGLDAQTANQKAMIELQKLSQEGQLGFANLGLQSQIAQNALLGNALQGGAGVLTGLGTLISDRTAKKSVKPADKSLRDFLDSLGDAESYEYKDKKHGEGRFASPMAQNLLKTELGRSMVEKTPEGLLGVNYGRGLGTILAAQASLNRRLKDLEDK